MKISSATSAFVNYLLEDAVDQLIQAGFDGIDLWCGRPHLFRQDHSPDSLKKLKEKIDHSGLVTVSAMPAFFRYPFSLSSPLETICEDSIGYMRDCIDNARQMAASHVLVVPTHSLYGQTSEDARKVFLHSLERVCDYAESSGMSLGIEVVYPKLSDYMHHTSQALAMIQELGSKILGVVIDTGHINLSGEDFQAALDNLGDHLLQVHINDNNAQEQQNAIPGEGNFNFARMADLLQRYGYQGFLTLELGWGYSFDPGPAVAEGLQRIRAYL